MYRRFPEYKGLDLAKVNKEVLKQWDNHDTFHSLRRRTARGGLSFMKAPFGQRHARHTSCDGTAIKDVICRYKTLKGFQVDRKAGWDTHGLPVELGVEKALGITKEDIGAERFQSRTITLHAAGM